jgi:hypothetical protein
MVGGQRRTYLLHEFSRTRPAPVVFVLHGGGGNAENAVSMTGFDRVGKREGLVVVYPNGTAARPRVPLLTWNAGHCCAPAMKGGVDDVGFIGALFDALVKDGRADLPHGGEQRPRLAWRRDGACRRCCPDAELRRQRSHVGVLREPHTLALTVGEIDVGQRPNSIS